jgi:hypothetical protein
VAHWRNLAGICAIIALGVFCVASVLPTFRALGRPIGNFGIAWHLAPNAGGANVMTATKVESGSPADRAGIAAGAFLPQSATALERIAAKQPSLPGTSRTFAFETASGVRPVALVAANGETYYPDDTFDRVFMAIRIPSTILLAAAAILLVVRLPGAMSWGLALFLLTLRPAALVNRFWAPLLSPEGWIALGGANRIIDTFGSVGIIVFALLFPSGEAPGKAARFFARSAWAFAAAIAAMLLVDDHLIDVIWPNTSFATHLFDSVRQGVIFLPWVAAVLLASTYLRAKGVERQRLAWVIAGLLVGCLSEPVNDIAARIGTQESGYVARSVGLLQLSVPILVGYGVMRHRILDVGFVLNRAAVYTALTTVLLGTMGLLRLTLGSYLKDNWAILLQVATAIGLGFSSQKIYKAADWLIDRYLFPDSHKNEVKLKRLGDGLRFAESSDAIAASITQEPVETLGLASAALFRKRHDGTFVRKVAVGWNGDDVTVIDAGDPLPIYLEGDATQFDVRDMLASRHGFPIGPAAPHHAYPLMVRRALAGFVLYSENADGTALDPDETAMLDKLVKAAADAYDPFIRVKRALSEAGAQARVQ